MTNMIIPVRQIFKLFLILAIIIFVIWTVNTNRFCANQISCIRDLTGNYESNNLTAKFEGSDIVVPSGLATTPLESNILGVSREEKRIEVNLTNQHLYAYEGNNLVYDFPVSTGKWGQTPTGTFNIWIKLRYTRMTGGNKDLGTYYNLPNVPYTMYFYNKEIPKTRGYGIHGAYWHNNFGHPMSHGCINMAPVEAEKLYYWADPPSIKNTTYADKDNPGTKIIIYGTAPNE